MREERLDTVEETARTRRRGRPKVTPDDHRRAVIVETGRRLFLERGFGRATMSEVAARARVSKRTLYGFFADKSALFAAVVEAHRHTMLAVPGDDDRLPLDEALRAIVRIDIDADEDRARHALLEMAFHESVAHPELREVILRHGVEKSRRDLASWLERRAAAGEVIVDDAEALAGILMDMVFGAGRPPLPGVVEPPEARRRRLERCIAVFLGGIGRR